MKWISVDDRLPEDQEDVLVYPIKRKEYGIAYRYIDDWWIFGGFGIDPTHWMSLEPPEDK